MPRRNAGLRGGKWQLENRIVKAPKVIMCHRFAYFVGPEIGRRADPKKWPPACVASVSLSRTYLHYVCQCCFLVWEFPCRFTTRVKRKSEVQTHANVTPSGVRVFSEVLSHNSRSAARVPQIPQRHCTRVLPTKKNLSRYLRL